jgi:hypothetical protein
MGTFVERLKLEIMDAGRLAQAAGLPLSSNPYTDQQLRHWWALGYIREENGNDDKSNKAAGAAGSRPQA